MSKPYIHAQSSAKKFGGEWTDYMDIHTFMDSSKSATATNIHRALTHNAWFIGVVLPAVFGETFERKSDGKVVSTRDIGEQHVAEDFRGFIPSASDFLDQIQLQPWMMNGKGLPPSFQKMKQPVEDQHTTHILETTYDGVPKNPKDIQPWPKDTPNWPDKGILVD